MTTDLTDRLKEFSKEMKDWDKKKTSVSGVAIVKLPTKGDDTNFGLEIIPVREDGIPLKRKGLFVTSLEQWEAFKEIFTNPKLLILFKVLIIYELQELQLQKKQKEKFSKFNHFTKGDNKG